MKLTSKIINPPCSSVIATSFIVSDERKKVSKVVVEGWSSAHVNRYGAAPDFTGEPLSDQCPPPDLLMLDEAVSYEEARI